MTGQDIASDLETSPFAKGAEFEFALGEKTLKKILKKRRIFELNPTQAYEQLSEANKRALVHLVKAADALNDIFLKLDHPDNIRAKRLLQAEAAKGSTRAADALELFNLHNGIEGVDMYAKKTKPLRLFKNKRLTPGKGHFPNDITKRELASYLAAHPEQIAAILGNSTVVRREGERLAAVPYSMAFRDEMEHIARELLCAAKETDHEGFASFLRWQAQALVNDSDPEAVYNADKAWLQGLEGSPLEFTIERESYADRLSGEIATDKKVLRLIKENGLVAKKKDMLGARVGIVNKESEQWFAEYERHLDDFRKGMPLIDQYRDQAEAACKPKIFYADVDLVALRGRIAASRRGGLTVAQNLPNSDKLSCQLGEGSRLVFHRQIRRGILLGQGFLDALIAPEQHRFYSPDASFLATIGHEMGHSVGPVKTHDGRDARAALGSQGATIEESKADLISLCMTDYFQSIGVFTDEQANQIYLTRVAFHLPFKQPRDDEAHKMREIMQLNYFREKGAILFEKGGKLSIVPEKMPETAKQMLTEIIAMQLEGDAAKADAFVKKYAAWNDAAQHAADERKKLNPNMYYCLRQPMAEKLCL